MARALAARWACDWRDTDDLVEARVGVTVGELLRTRGEGALRDVEVEVLRTALASDAVVSTGGGVVSRDEARALLREEPTIWLDCADEVVASRVSDGDRPLLGEDPRAALGELRERREAWYREVSRERVDAASELDEVIDAVIEVSGRVAPCG